MVKNTSIYTFSRHFQVKRWTMTLNRNPTVHYLSAMPHTHTPRAIRYIIHIRNAALLWTHRIFLNYVFNVPLDDMQMLLDVIEVLDCLVRSESACVTLLLTHCQLLQWARQWVSTNRNIKTTLAQCFICPHVLKKHSWIWVRHHMKYY